MDRVLGDSMAAALIGHPGGYYTEVSGGEPGNTYTGQLLVSPPNLLRMIYSFDGFLDLLWENLWSMGESDPDAYAALDFDDINLDYFLLTSELPSYNQNPYYTYENADGIFDLYNMYALNTLGYLETQVSQASDGQYDAIRPTCIDGRPQYEFINSTLYQAVRPQSVLYRPIVLSQERYDQLQPAPGSLVVQARCKDYSNTIGINAYNMSDLERGVYAAKVPLNDNGFEYPIRQISIDMVKYNIYTGFSYFVKGFVVNESDYSIDLGNLYFTKSIEELVSEKNAGFEEFLSFALAHEIIESKIYFNVRIVFDLFIPDTTEESSSLALAQATSHAIMDYFNQYVFAETSANMIGEITYTETMTFWSTLISAPLVYFGSWAVKGTETMMTQAGVESVKAMLLKGVSGFALSPIKEVFQEIIEDGFIEALSENFIDILGGTEDAGFWVSSFFTSVRETTGALGQLALGDAGVAFGDANLMTKLSLISARISGDANAIAEITASVQQSVEQKQADADLKRQQMKSWQKLVSSGFFKGLLMFLPSVLFGSFSFVALKGLNNMIDSTERAVPRAYARIQSEVHAYRKGKLMDRVGTKDSFGAHLQKELKKPAGLEAAKPEINEKYKASQETKKENPPLAAFLSSLNPNPKTESKESLANKFNEIQISDWIRELSQDYRFEGKKERFENIKDATKELDYTKRLTMLIEGVRHTLRTQYPNSLKYTDITGTIVYDPKFILTGINPGNPDLFKLPKNIDPNWDKNKVKYINEVDFDIPATSTALNVIEYLNIKIYKTFKDLRLFTLDGQEIPLYAVVSDWLKKNGHSGDAPIIVVPIDLISAGKGVFNRGNWQIGSPSPYWPSFDKFRHALRDILHDNGAIQNSLWATVSKFISTSGRENILSSKLSYMKIGKDKYSFDVAMDTLNKWHIEIEYNLNKKHMSNEITDQERELVTSEIDKLFQEQYKLYGHDELNPLYMPARVSLYAVARVVYDYHDHKYLDSYSISDFAIKIGLTPHYEKFKSKDNYIPEKGTWDLSSKLEAYLESIDAPDNEIQEILGLVKPYSDVLLHKIHIERTSQDLFKDFPNTRKVELLRRIVNCPDTDILKMVNSITDLSKILFNHPNYDQEGGSYYQDRNYIHQTVFSYASAEKVTYMVYSLIARAAQLKIDDFKVVGLEQEIDQNELDLLKIHISETIEKFLRDFNLISSEGSKLFKIPAINKLLYKAIEKMHIAAAIREGDTFLGMSEGSEVLNIPQYNRYLAKGMTIDQDMISEAIRKLYDFVTEALYTGTRSIVSSMHELEYYYDAINALNELSQRIDLVENIYKRAAKISEIYCSSYSNLWYDPAYKAWNVLTQLQDLFGTEVLSFESLDEQIFDKNYRTGLFEPHHMDPGHKESLALYDQILTNNDYHATYNTMPIAQQRILKEGVRRLVQMGIEGRGSAKGGYINADDIRKVFAGQTFDVRSRKTDKMEYNIPILSEKTRFWQRNREKIGLWDYHFSNVDFKDKLSNFNIKIKRFRETLQQTGSRKEAYMAVLSFKYGIALTRFYNDAVKFANFMFAPSLLIKSPLFPLNFGDNRHLVITKILF